MDCEVIKCGHGRIAGIIKVWIVEADGLLQFLADRCVGGNVQSKEIRGFLHTALLVAITFF